MKFKTCTDRAILNMLTSHAWLPRTARLSTTKAKKASSTATPTAPFKAGSTKFDFRRKGN